MTSAHDQGRIPTIEVRHRLHIARDYAGLDQTDLAVRMGVARSTISNAEKGKGVPLRSTIKLWSMACGVPVSWILTGEQPDDGPGPTHGLGIKRAIHAA